MKQKKILLTLACVFATLWLTAQEAPKSLSLSLQEAQDYAIAHNVDLRNSSLQIREAKLKEWQSIATMLPQVTTNFQYMNMCGYTMELGMGPMKTNIAMPPYGNFGLQTAVTINGQTVLAVLLQQTAKDMQDINFEQTQHNLRINVMQSYLAVLVTESIVALLDSSLSNLQALADMTQRSVEVGVSEQTAADQILVRVSAIKNSLNANKRSVQVAYNALRLMLDIDSDTELHLTQSLEELLSAEAALTMLSKDFDINRNFSYRLQLKNTELAKRQLILSTMEYSPTLSAYYQYSARKYFSNESTMNMQAPNTVGLTLSLPLFTSFKSGASITEKKLAYERALNTLDYTQDALGVQDKQLRFNLANSYETYINEVKNIEVTKRVFNSTSNKYQYGVASSLELTNASNDLIAAQNTYVQAVLSLVNAQVEFMKFMNE